MVKIFTILSPVTVKVSNKFIKKIVIEDHTTPYPSRRRLSFSLGSDGHGLSPLTRRYLIYSETDFEVFRPAGATRCTDWGEISHGGGDLTRSPPPCHTMRQTPKVLEVQERARAPLSLCQVWWGSDFTSRRVGQKRRVFVAPVFNFVRLLPIGDNTKCRSSKNGKNGGFSPTEGDRINRSRRNLASKHIPWVCYTPHHIWPSSVKEGRYRSLPPPKKMSKFAQNCFLVTGSRHNEQIDTKFAV